MPKIGQQLYKPYFNTEQCKIWIGDAIDILSSFHSGSIDLAFADPPFNNGYKYDVYNDNKTKEEYLQWTERWLCALKKIMKVTGSLYVAIGIKYQAEMKILIEQAGFYWRDTICWHYTFGPRQTNKFTPSWVPIHYATMCKNYETRFITGSRSGFTWNPEAIQVQSARQLVYNDKRAKATGKNPDNVWVLTPGTYDECFTEGSNSMLASRVCGTFKERTGHPAQMPEAILDRIIRVSSNEGDLVLDPFAGSGTTLVAALKRGRKCLGIELSQNYVKQYLVPRIKSTIENYAANTAASQ